jgi:hypothetical protein
MYVYQVDVYQVDVEVNTDFSVSLYIFRLRTCMCITYMCLNTRTGSY